MYSFLRFSFLQLALLLVAVVGSAAANAWDNDKILRLGPKDVPAAAGTVLRSLRVAIVHNGVFEPIPFQFDEYNTAGLVWFAPTGVAIKGREGIFDGDDQLFLLAADLGTEPVNANTKLPPGWLGEVSATIQGETRYFEVIAGDFPRSPQVYVKHDVITGTTETPFYTLLADPQNELNWRFLMVKSWRGDHAQSLVDTLKMRISGGVFTPVPRIRLDNDNLRPKLVGVKTGPIRSTMQLETAVVVTGITVMRMQVQVIRYPRYFEAFTHARLPRLYRMALSDPEVRVTVDANNMKGAVTRTARGGNLQGVVDGVMDVNEKQLIARGMSSDEDWLLFDTRGGFSMMTFLDVPPELRKIPLQLVYEDDPQKADKPERIVGQQPNLGYGIRGFPPGEDFRFGVTLAFDKDLVDNVDPRAYVARWREEPVYKFRAASRP